MAKKQRLTPSKHAVILIFILISFFPFIVYPEFYLGRQNDLNNFFLPLIVFVKNTLVNYRQLPLWNTAIFSGTPLVTDPQAPIFYLPNLLHIILPYKSAFLILAFTHLYLGALGMYFYLNKNLKLKSHPSYLGTFIYLFAPRLAAYFEAGHVGLIYSWSYLPWILLFLGHIVNKKNFYNILGLGLCMTALFFTHTPTFYIVALIFPFLYVLHTPKVGQIKKSILYILAAALIAFGFVAIALLPQLMWQGNTTRQFLLQNPETFPIWHSKGEFLKACINPLLLGLRAIWQLDTEKYLSLGVFSLALALVGWWRLNRKLKISALLMGMIIVLIVLNNASPIYPLLLNSKFFILLRVMTRAWFIPVIVVSILAARGFEVLYKNKPKMGMILSALTACELLLLFWGRTVKPINLSADKAPEAIYSYLQVSAINERVFCTTKCLSYDKAALYNLQLIEGYGTLAQTNYFQRAKVTMGTYWHDKYDLSIPPTWITYSENLDPQALYLAEYSVGYVVSPHPLSDNNLTLVQEIDNFKIYKNTINKPRAYFENGSNVDLIYESPNKLIYRTNGTQTGKLTFSEVYSPGWQAKIDGKKVAVTETNIAQRSINVPKGSQIIEIYYLPREFVWGLIISITTTILISSYAIYKKIRH